MSSKDSEGSVPSDSELVSLGDGEPRRRRRRRGTDVSPTGSSALVVPGTDDQEGKKIQTGLSFAKPAEQFPDWNEILAAVRQRFVEITTDANAEKNAADKLKDQEPYMELVRRVLSENPQWRVGPADLGRLIRLLRAYQFGYGALEDYMELDGLEEIYFNSPDEGFYIVHGQKRKFKDQIFRDRAEMVEFVQRVANANNLQVNASQPNLDAQLDDGSRLNTTLDPIAYGSPDIVIRKHRDIPFTIEQLIDNGMITRELADDINIWMNSRFNVVVSGSTGSGKTSLLNTLGNSFLPKDDRVLILETNKELQFATEDTKYFQTLQDATRESGELDITIRDLVRYALRKRPDRIVVGEIRGQEAYHALRAWSTGHDGSLCTLHADSAPGALQQLEMMARSAGELDNESLRQLISQSVDIVIQVDRKRGGAKRAVREVIQVLHPYKFDYFDDAITAQVEQLRETKQLRKLSPEVWILPIYREVGGRLRKVNSIIPLAGRG